MTARRITTPDRRPIRPVDLGDPYEGGSFHIILEGVSASAGQTSLILQHGVLELAYDHPAIPVSSKMLSGKVACAFKATSTPAGPWTFVIQVRRDGTDEFIDEAYFTANTS